MSRDIQTNIGGQRVIQSSNIQFPILIKVPNFVFILESINKSLKGRTYRIRNSSKIFPTWSIGQLLCYCFWIEMLLINCYSLHYTFTTIWTVNFCMPFFHASLLFATETRLFRVLTVSFPLSVPTKSLSKLTSFHTFGGLMYLGI